MKYPSIPPGLYSINFPFWDDEQGFITPSADQLEALARYLHHEFGVTGFIISGPYLVLYCNQIAEVNTRPFTIAVCMAVWLEEVTALPAELSLGDPANGSDIELNSAIAGELHSHHLLLL